MQYLSRFGRTHRFLSILLLLTLFALPTGTVHAQPEQESEQRTLRDSINDKVKATSGIIFGVLFADISFGVFKQPAVDPETGAPVLDENGNPVKEGPEAPLLVVVLLFGGVYFTFFFRFINFRGFKHSLEIIRGKYDRPEDEGEVSHFRALTSALSATVGLGNIAGVAIAISVGGPGAVFWMVLTAFFGMSTKFSSCTLSQMYRRVNPDGTISGGPMYYLDMGLGELGGFFKGFGKVLAVMFAIMVMGAALGGGNLFQTNQSYAVVRYVFELEGRWPSYIYGIFASILVGVVILGGIKRIGAATSRIVPVMAVIYVLGCLVVILTNIGQLPSAIGLILKHAFTDNAVFGGFIGVLIQGVRRAGFSNEAGLGSAAIAHAAARTKEPVREGMVAMIGPFVDTVIICTMTALVVVITGVYAMTPAELKELTAGQNIQDGAALTAVAFGSVMDWFPFVLAIAVALFAYSTMISWCYYGERGWIYLLDHFGGNGIQTVIVFRILFVVFAFVGAVASNLGDVVDLSDALLLSLAFPNIIGSLFLAPKVAEKLKDYWRRYKSGEMQPMR